MATEAPDRLPARRPHSVGAAPAGRPRWWQETSDPGAVARSSFAERRQATVKIAISFHAGALMLQALGWADG